MACQTTTHWATHVTAECAPGGSGSCDGFCEAHPGTECSCECHREWCTTLPNTVDGVRQWHDERNDVVATFDGPTAESDAVTAARGMEAVTPSMIFAPQKGQNRYIVTRSHR